jgi:hypothetical protein
MKIRNIVLSSASALVLTTGLALAQTNDPYTHNSTPQEQVQTDQLNQQAGQDAQTPPTQDTSDPQSRAQQQQYQGQQEQYQDDQRYYQDQQARYQDQQAQYEFDRSHPGAWWHDRYDRASLNHFYDIPRTELVDLRVIREDGMVIGRIRELDRHDDGRVESVRIVFRDGGSAWVKARDLRYDPEDRIVFTDLSVRELREMARNS